MDYAQLLLGKRAFVSAGARGIGRAIALLFARQGATLILADQNADALAQTLESVQALAPASRGFVTDLSNAQATEALARQVLEGFGGVDVLVNVVGVNQRCPAAEYQDEVLESLLESNYKCGLRLARAFLPGMVQRGDGAVVNISSIHAVETMPGYTLYAGTKGAVNASARAMALDYAGTGVRVNTVCPGLIMSDALLDEVAGYPEGEPREAFEAMLRHMQPLAPGQPEDIANAALFLASPMAAYITGQVVMVDGGASCKAH